MTSLVAERRRSFAGEEINKLSTKEAYYLGHHEWSRCGGAVQELWYTS